MRFLGPAAVLLFALTGCSGRAHSPAVDRVEVAPTPWGRSLAASTATSRGAAVLSSVTSAVPKTLPPNPAQTCHLGTTITITVGIHTHRYGPCAWPPSIERLRQAFLRADHVPPQAAKAGTWKAVLADWYDGRMDSWHSCAAVHDAIHHLPEDPPTYSTIQLDLRAYARGVC